MADWDKIRAEYISGGISTRKLAAKHGVTYSALRFRCEKEGWVDAQRKKSARTTQKVIERAAEKAAKKTADIVDIADALLLKLQESIESISSGDLESMTSAANILFKLRETKKGLSAADAREQEARIAKLLKDVEKAEEPSEITVSFEGCDPEWLR